jgi:hypothetical protein
MAEMVEMANLLAKSDFVPKEYIGKPGNIIAAAQLGSEIGIGVMTALQGIGVINGKPSVYGDLGVALVQRARAPDGNPLLENCKEEWVGTGDNKTAICRLWRRGIAEPFEGRFSFADAKRADLLGKDTYRKYPERMIMWRARSWAYRNGFSDALKGLIFREEAEDFPAVEAPRPAIIQPRRASAAPAPVAQEAPITVDSRPIEEAPPPAPPEATKASEDPAPSNGPEKAPDAATGTGGAFPLKSGSVDTMEEHEVRPALEGVIQSIADKEGKEFAAILDRIASFDGKDGRVTVRSLDMVFKKGTKWGRKLYHDAKKDWSKS